MHKTMYMSLFTYIDSSDNFIHKNINIRLLKRDLFHTPLEIYRNKIFRV